jgi:hypothetical protein
VRRKREEIEERPQVTIRDICFRHEGSIILAAAITDAGKAWLAENCPHDEDHQYFGKALVVEPRYLDNLIQGMQNDGLSV